MSDENVPLDAVAMSAEAVVQAALNWAIAQDSEKMTREEWLLLEAVDQYGDEYRGLRAR